MAKKAMAMAMATHRRRMTLDEEARVYAHYVSNPLVSMAALAEWAAALFRLDKVPAESTMVSLVQWYKEHPERSGGGAGDASEHAGGYRIEEEEEEEEEEEIDEREERDGETQDNATTPITSTTTMTAPTTPKRGRKPKGTGAPAGTTIQSAIISKLYATLEPELQEWLVEVETRGESPSVQEIRKKAATIRDRLLKNHPRPKTIQKSMKFTVEWVRKFQEQCYNQKDASQQLSQMAATQLSSFADAALTSAQTAPPRQSAPPSRIIRMIPDAPLVAKKVVPRLPIKPKGRAIPRPTAAEAAATTTTTGIMATSSGKVRGKHMTKEQKDRIYEQYQADPMMSLQELANWAAAEFQLSKTPSVSTVSNVLKQHQERPDQSAVDIDEMSSSSSDGEDATSATSAATATTASTTAMTADSTGSATSSGSIVELSAALEQELLRWVKNCEERGERIPDNWIRDKATAIRDRLLTNHTHPETLKSAMEFSMEWLRRFQQKHQTNLLSAQQSTGDEDDSLDMNVDDTISRARAPTRQDIESAVANATWHPRTAAEATASAAATARRNAAAAAAATAAANAAAAAARAAAEAAAVEAAKRTEKEAKRNAYNQVTQALEKRVLLWTRVRGERVPEHEIRLEAASVREKMLKSEPDPLRRAALAEMRFTMGWLQVFQDKYNLPTYEKPSENAAQTTGAKRGRDEFGTFNGSNRPGPSIEHRSKRARMTYGEKAQLYAYHLANPSVTRYWLGEWAASQFNLVTVPSESSISKLLRKQREIHENPDRMAEGIDGTSSFMNTDARKKTYKVTCPALESELIRWIYECRSRGEQVGGKLVQQKAHALRDLLLQENRPDIDHNALAAMTFSQGWLYRFQTKFELLTRRNKTKAKKKELSRPKYLLRTHMTLEEKERLYEQYQTDPSMKMTALADWATNEFKLAKPPSRSTMSGIIKRYKERLAAGINTEDEDSPIQRADAATRKKYTTVVCPQLEKELLKWVLSCKMKGENVSGKAIAAKAAALRDELLTEQRYHPRHEVLADMTFSNGWLYRFQQRYGIFSRAKRSTTTSVRTVRKNPAARGRVTKKR